MAALSLIAVAGPCGSGKTSWISQHLKAPTRPLFYFCPGAGNVSVDLAQIGYRFPWVQVIPEQQVQSALSALPDSAVVYIELGFHLALDSPFLKNLPCHRAAVLPPSFQDSEWHDWADEVIPGNTLPASDAKQCSELWRTPLTGQVFDPPSLDDILIELTEGAYGAVSRVKGIFELPDGRAFHVSFVQGIPGIEYAELQLPRWLDGRPERFSGIEVVGENLQQAAISQAILDSCLAEDLLRQNQQHYRETLAEETMPV